MSIGTVLLLVTYVLPKFKTFFKSFHAKLPLPTRMLLAVGDFFSQPTASSCSAPRSSFVVFLVVYLQTERREAQRATRSLLKIRMVKDVIRFAVIERFCRILERHAEGRRADSRGDDRGPRGDQQPRVLRRRSVDARDADHAGRGHLAADRRDTTSSRRPPRRCCWSASSRARSTSSSTPTADYCEGERSYRLKRLTTLFEPVVIVLMGLIVGFVAIALVSAMYGIFNQVKLK